MIALTDAPDLPLLANLPIPDRKADLPHMGLAEHVIADYQSLGLSLKAHPLRFLRESSPAMLYPRRAVEARRMAVARSRRIAVIASAPLEWQRGGDSCAGRRGPRA